MQRSLPLTLSALLLTHPALAQTHARKPQTGLGNAAAQLPVTHVSLYKNGVGFFEHAGRITGDGTVTLDLTTAQLNDALQTLTAVDLGGGRITGAGYNSTTPLDQQLRALPLSLGEQPTEADLYSTLRGARVAVTGSGAPFTGRILSLEVRNASVATGSDSEPAPQARERRHPTVIADTGTTRTLELTPATSVRLLDMPLRTGLNTYLELLDRNRTEGLRHLTLTSRGTGTRDLRVSFLAEVPVWKSTYRILFTDQHPDQHPDRPSTASASVPSQSETATIQGFSVVDNTTGEDWSNVQLSLIAGSPQSFLQPLAQPIYTRRAEIPIAQDAQLTPQTHDSAIQMLKEDGAQPPAVAGVAGMSGMATGNGSGMGGGGGIPSPRKSGISAVHGQRLAEVGAVSQTVSVNAPAQPVPYEAAASASNAPGATTAAFDDYFAYNLTDPVTIPRNGSALVPILQTTIASERVTLWSPSEPAPLRALWITNASSLTLDRGSFTIVENGSFGGEGLLETIHPGERRLLSYAADQAVRVSVDHRNDTRRVTAITADKGILRAATTEVAEVEYLVSNAAPERRTVIVEEPRRPSWTLDSDPKPAETTPAAYRFRVAAAPTGSVRLHVGQRHTLDQYFRLTDSTEEQLTVFLRGANATPALLAQLEPVFAAKRAVAGLDAQIAAKQQAITQLIEDQKRVRDNLGAMKGTAEERSLAKRYTAELNAQEDTLATLRRDLATLQTQREAAQSHLSSTIDSLHLIEKV